MLAMDTSSSAAEAQGGAEGIGEVVGQETW